MKKKFKALLIILIVSFITSPAKTADQTGSQITEVTCEKTVSQTNVQITPKTCGEVDVTEGKTPEIRYESLEVPNIDSSFKTWMSYRAVTNKCSPQYNYIHTYGWTDEEGFMRAKADEAYNIEQDYYLIALGSYYGTEIGTKYRITLDTGRVFYGVLADCKDDKHTNSTNQYISHNGNVVEFLVDKTKLNKTVRKSGNAGSYEPLKGNITKIEKIIL